MAILELGAQRIGHGTTLLEDKDVLELVISQNVCIEACVTSNLHTGVIASFEEHPIVEWLQHGVRVSICTDNTLLSQVNAPQEYARVSSLPQMTNEYIEQCIDFGCSALFR
jgi:adenosine deaminase